MKTRPATALALLMTTAVVAVAGCSASTSEGGTVRLTPAAPGLSPGLVLQDYRPGGAGTLVGSWAGDWEQGRNDGPLGVGRGDGIERRQSFEVFTYDRRGTSGNGRVREHSYTRTRVLDRGYLR